VSERPDDATLETVNWVGGAAEGFLRLIDQTRLPQELVRIECRDVPAVWEAIRSLRVRGAPAIGIAAAFGAVLGGQPALGGGDAGELRRAVREATRHLRTSRPTAVNLFWALDRIDRVVDPGAEAEAEGAGGPSAADVLGLVLAEARAIADEDKAMCRAIGRFGAGLVAPRAGGADPTATPAAWPPPITAPPWRSSSPHTSRARRSTSSPTRPARCSRGRG